MLFYYNFFYKWRTILIFYRFFFVDRKFIKIWKYWFEIKVKVNSKISILIILPFSTQTIHLPWYNQVLEFFDWKPLEWLKPYRSKNMLGKEFNNIIVIIQLIFETYCLALLCCRTFLIKALKKLFYYSIISLIREHKYLNLIFGGNAPF